MEEESQEPYVMSQPIDPNVSNATLIAQINPEKIVEEIEHTLRNETYDPNETKWVQKLGADTKSIRPFLNDEGLAAVITRIRGVVNQNTIMSNLNDHEVEVIMIALSDEIIGLIAMRYQEYEIDKAHLSLLVNLITDMCFLALKRCLNQGERKFLNTSVHSQEQVIIRAGEKSNKKFSFFRKN